MFEVVKSSVSCRVLMNQGSQSEWCVCLCVCERERDGRVWRTRTGLVTVNAVFVEVEAA